MTGNSYFCRPRKPPKPEKARELPEKWLGKPYYSLDAYCKNTFQRKCFKIALNAHMTCPIGTGRWAAGAVSSAAKGEAANLPWKLPETEILPPSYRRDLA